MYFLIIVAIAAIQTAPTVLCGEFASDKGRSIGGWVFLGSLFSWIALIVLACLPDTVSTSKYTPVQNFKDFQASNSLTCPICKTVIKVSGLNSVASCNTQAVIPPNANNITKIDKYRCAECGETIDTPQCPWCGYHNGKK